MPPFMDRWSCRFWRVYSRSENARHAAFLHNQVPGINIPLPAIQRLQDAGDEAAAHVGVEIALELAEKLKPLAKGLYLIPAFSRYDLVAEIIELLKNRKSKT